MKLLVYPEFKPEQVVFNFNPQFLLKFTWSKTAKGLPVGVLLKLQYD